jgi:murein hydrolase activator
LVQAFYLLSNITTKTMMRVIFSFAIFYFTATAVCAQQTREELERQRKELRKEIDETQKLLEKNKAVTSKGLTSLIILSNKAELQEKVVNNFSKDLNILDNNIYNIQRDVNKYDRLLDTLKLEYSKSMVYAYKNRGNYEFLNFIFSANNFNDAIKRVAYLKSYRAYREMQGQNIMRTQDLRRKRLEDLGVTKQTKSVALNVQTDEMKKLEEQKQEQDRIVAQLKKEGKDLNTRIAEKQRQVAKVNAAVKAAIAKAIREDNERRKIAEAAAKKKRDEARAEEERLARIKKAADDKAARDKRAADIAKGKTPDPIKETPKEAKPPKAPREVVVPESRDLNTENYALNSSFERNRGSLPWPVDNGAILNHFGPLTLHSGAKMQNSAITISSSIGSSVKAVFDGKVILVIEIDEGKFTVIVQHGNYYTTYSNMTNIAVKKDQDVKTGTILGRVAPNLDGIGSIDFYSAKGNTDLNPELWLRRR